MVFHGGNIYDFEKKVIDFSSNINPIGIPNSFVEILTQEIDKFTLYPDITYRELRSNLRKYLEIKNEDYIVPGNGAIELIYKYIEVSGVREIFLNTPTFAEYAKAAKLAAKNINEIPINCEIGFEAEIFLDKITQESLVILCNPNNPTGSFIPKKNLVDFLGKLADKNSFLLLDESFIEFTSDYPENSLVDLIDAHQNLIIIRAATKFFGMPGLRLGYLITANEEVLGKLRARMEPWNINTAALLGSKCIFFDADYIKKSRNWIREERNFMSQELAKLKKISSYPTEANFFLLKINDEQLDAWQLRDKLLEEGFYIRTPDGFSNLSKYHFRIAIKDHKSNLLLIEALQRFFDSV